MNYREGEKNKSFKSHLESTDIHHEITKWELERQINGFQSDVEHDAWMTLSFPSGWIMSSLASVCHLISQNLSTVRAVIIWTQQVKGVCSFLNGSRPKNLHLLEKENKNKLLCGKPEKNKGKGRGSCCGKTEVWCLWPSSFIAGTHEGQLQLFSTKCIIWGRRRAPVDMSAMHRPCRLSPVIAPGYCFLHAPRPLTNNHVWRWVLCPTTACWPPWIQHLPLELYSQESHRKCLSSHLQTCSPYTSQSQQFWCAPHCPRGRCLVSSLCGKRERNPFF